MTSTEVEPLKMSLTELKSASKSNGNENKLELLLKEVYRTHKDIIKSSSNVWKDKFEKMKTLKNKISASKKSLQMECDSLKEENKSLKEFQKSYLNLRENCKNCEHLQLALVTLRKSFQMSFDEQDKLIQHLGNQLATTCKDQSIDSSSVKLSLDNEKHNRLRLKSLQKKVVYTQKEADKFSQPIDNNNNNCGDQQHSKILVPETVEYSVVRNETSEEVSLLPEETICPQSLLFSKYGFESDSDSGDNEKDVDSQKLLAFESPNLKESTDKKISNICPTNLELGSLEWNSKQEVTRSVSPTFSSSKELISTNTPNTSPTLVPFPTTDVSLVHNYMTDNQTPTDSLTNSPRCKKRRTLRSQTHVQKANQRDPQNDLLKKPSQWMCNTQNITTPSKSQSSEEKENYSKNSFSPVDPDKTVPPENWNNTTVLPLSEMNDMLTEPSSQHIANKNWSQNNENMTAKKLITDSLHNGSLAPSMCMTEFLLQNEELTNNKPTEIVSKKSDSTRQQRYIEESQMIIPSDSYKFEDGKPEVMPNIDEMNHISEDNEKEYEKPDIQKSNSSILDSFDRIPQKKDLPYAYDIVVRKKHERKQLNGYTCQQCVEYYKAKGLSDEEIKKQIGNCSKHRAKYKPPNTPQHFWSIGFPDTEECEKRGYFTRECKSLPSRGEKQGKERKTESKKNSKKENKEYRMTQLLDYLDHGSEEED